MIAAGPTDCAARESVVAWPGADLPALLEVNDAVVCCARAPGARSAVHALVREILGAAFKHEARGGYSIGGTFDALHPNVLSRVSATILAEGDMLRSPGGKPYIAARGRPLNFNVSHSGDALLVALSRTAEVGVDVERIRVVPEWRAIATRMFDAAVRERLFGQVACGADEGEAFVSYWCRHEACVKATGEGLFPSETRDDASDSNAERAQTRVIDLPELPLPAGAGRYRGALAILQ